MIAAVAAVTAAPPPVREDLIRGIRVGVSLFGSVISIAGIPRHIPTSSSGSNDRAITIIEVSTNLSSDLGLGSIIVISGVDKVLASLAAVDIPAIPPPIINILPLASLACAAVAASAEVASPIR